VAAALGERAEPIALAPLVAYLPDERLLVQSQVHGPSLLEVIREAASLEEAVAAVRRAARAVAALHRLPLAAPPHRLKQGRMDPERLRRRAEELCATHPDLASLVAEVEAGIRAGFATIGEAPSAPVHGDLKPNHLLFDDRIVLLDLDKFAAGDPMLDVANLLRQLRGSGSAVTQAFVEEYFAHVPAAWEHRLTPHYAWALLKEASTASKSARHESRVTPLLMGAHAVLAGGDGSSNPEPDRIPGNGERSARREERRSQCNT
jgi:aminoglycoside phosphotransferase (APT) family kinase protein